MTAMPTPTMTGTLHCNVFTSPARVATFVLTERNVVITSEMAIPVPSVVVFSFFSATYLTIRSYHSISPFQRAFYHFLNRTISKETLRIEKYFQQFKGGECRSGCCLDTHLKHSVDSDIPLFLLGFPFFEYVLARGSMMQTMQNVWAWG